MPADADNAAMARKARFYVPDSVEHCTAGIGLASVHRRIQAYYGEQGRLRSASSPLFGTYVSVLVPDSLIDEGRLAE